MGEIYYLVNKNKPSHRIGLENRKFSAIKDEALNFLGWCMAPGHGRDHPVLTSNHDNKHKIYLDGSGDHFLNALEILGWELDSEHDGKIDCLDCGGELELEETDKKIYSILDSGEIENSPSEHFAETELKCISCQKDNAGHYDIDLNDMSISAVEE